MPFQYIHDTTQEGIIVLRREIFLILNAHKTMCHTLQIIKQYYSPLLLVSIACCNLNVLLNLYFAIFGGYIKLLDKSKYFQTSSDIINNFMWGSYYFLRFFAVALFAELVTSEVCYCWKKFIKILIIYIL